MPAHTRTVCLEFFGQAREAIPAIVEIKNYLDGLAVAEFSSRVWSTWTSAICAPWATAPSPSAAPCLRWRCLVTSSATRNRRWLRPPPRSCASPTRAAARASSLSAPRRDANSGWIASRTAAIARHTNAFKINEDVVIPLGRMGEYTDAIERINIEFSLANKLRLIDELRQMLASPLPLARGEDNEIARTAERRGSR